uniref:LIM domain only protein 3 n=1 Tax=Astyanax mexicanus TaxID=7994 RepID=A0A3B1IQ40_ASTMX
MGATQWLLWGQASPGPSHREGEERVRAGEGEGEMLAAVASCLFFLSGLVAICLSLLTCQISSHWMRESVIIIQGIQMLSVQPDTKPKGCAGCNRKIKDRYLLKALDKYWHEDCLKCACCDCRLGEVGSTLYTKANLILCRRDYLRLFGVTGNCAACSKLIPAFEMVMRAKENVYHLDCFACQLCNQRFCVGDKFFLKNNMILCQTDYEEGLMKEGYAPQVR